MTYFYLLNQQFNLFFQVIKLIHNQSSSKKSLERKIVNDEAMTSRYAKMLKENQEIYQAVIELYELEKEDVYFVKKKK